MSSATYFRHHTHHASVEKEIESLKGRVRDQAVELEGVKGQMNALVRDVQLLQAKVFGNGNAMAQSSRRPEVSAPTAPPINTPLVPICQDPSPPSSISTSMIPPIATMAASALASTSALIIGPLANNAPASSSAAQPNPISGQPSLPDQSHVQSVVNSADGSIPSQETASLTAVVLAKDYGTLDIALPMQAMNIDVPEGIGKDIPLPPPMSPFAQPSLPTSTARP